MQAFPAVFDTLGTACLSSIAPETLVVMDELAFWSPRRPGSPGRYWMFWTARQVIAAVKDRLMFPFSRPSSPTPRHRCSV